MYFCLELSDIICKSVIIIIFLGIRLNKKNIIIFNQHENIFRRCYSKNSVSQNILTVFLLTGISFTRELHCCSHLISWSDISKFHLS